MLDPGRSGRRSSSSRGTGQSRAARPGGATREPVHFRGAYAAAGPYVDEEGERYEVRLEKVPGGVRLGEWAAGRLRRRAPVLAREDLVSLVREAGEGDALEPADRATLTAALDPPRADTASPAGKATHGSSPGRTGVMEEELRVEGLPDGDLVRVARWVRRPRGEFELHDAAPMLPAGRYAEALRNAAAGGVLSGPAAASGEGEGEDGAPEGEDPSHGWR